MPTKNNTMPWNTLDGQRADRVRKLCGTDEYILIHEERMPSWSSTGEDTGSIRVWYDPVERMLYRERAYDKKSSTWQSQTLPISREEQAEHEEDDS